ncbi:MAG: DUF1080 domain-containing protein [bacterium]|nr:DUF1080 domain-containing protein [bacterium]
MRTTTTARVALMAALTAALALTASAELPEGEGWVSMFNGKDLAEWKVTESNKGLWSVVDATIDCNPRRDRKGDKSLWSKKEYKDFTLRVDWRIKECKGKYNMYFIQPDGSAKLDENGKMIVLSRPNADSGIYLRGKPNAQVNIWCWPAGSGEVWGYRTDKKMPPEVRAGVVPKECADKPVGEWNTFEITMKGDRLTVVLNGKKVIDNAQLPGVPEAGPIALQHHGGYAEAQDAWDSASSLVQFRNIYIKELPKAE